jgi:transcriptional regulator of acetoin/glycerol metabolism
MKVKLGIKYKILMFLHRNFGLKPQKVWRYSGISRATFYRQKKKVEGTLIKSRKSK